MNQQTYLYFYYILFQIKIKIIIYALALLSALYKLQHSIICVINLMHRLKFFQSNSGIHFYFIYRQQMNFTII
jgi:hypothetical protein